MKILMLAAALVASGFAVAADTPPASPLDRLAVFAGTWKSVGQNFKTPYSEEADTSSTVTNQCWKTGAFFICNQSVNGVSRVLVVFTYQSGDTYAVSNIPAEGGHASNGTLVLSGGVWTFPGQSHKYGQVTYFRTVNIYSNYDNLDYREEYSEDQQTWTPMAQGHETRIRN
ncbi:MAG: hypothetical protein ACM3ZT_02635 [Bacillota bacterium]